MIKPMMKWYLAPVFSYEDKEVVTFHSQLAAHVIDTLLSLQQAMSASKLKPTW